MATPWDDFITAIERRKSQLDELLEAYGTFRKKLDALPPEVAQEAQRILASSASDPQPEKQDFVGKSALDCARVILEEHSNEPMHFSDIARAAMARGYRGRAEGTPSEVESRVQNSFWAALHRSGDFASAGKGCYRLAVREPSRFDFQLEEPDRSPKNSPAMTQKEAARRVLQELGRPAKVAEIRDEAVRRGWLHVSSTQRNLSNSLYGMMTNTPGFRKVGPGEFALTDQT
jgi:HB1, ASXL, restriction endonuclease HTH domain